MRLLVADTRPVSADSDPGDRHRDELIAELEAERIELAYLHPGQSGAGQGRRTWQVEGRAWLRFVQVEVPSAARALDMDGVLCLFGGAPLRCPVPLFSFHPTFPPVVGASLWSRLALAAGRAGVGGAAGRFRYADLDGQAGRPGNTALLQPWVSQLFSPEVGVQDLEQLRKLGLATGYALAFGVPDNMLNELIQAWRWVVQATGDSHQLLVLGKPEQAPLVVDASARSGLENVIRHEASPALGELAVLFRQASVFIHVGGSHTGQSLRWALASGRPIAGYESSATGALVGDAAYLLPPGDRRGLGAAALSILVQEELSRSLQERARQRAGSYARPQPLLEMLEFMQAPSRNSA